MTGVWSTDVRVLVQRQARDKYAVSYSRGHVAGASIVAGFGAADRAGQCRAAPSGREGSIDACGPLPHHAPSTREFLPSSRPIRRSGSADYPGPLARVEGCPRCRSALRGLDTRGALPSGLQLSERPTTHRLPHGIRVRMTQRSTSAAGALTPWESRPVRTRRKRCLIEENVFVLGIRCGDDVPVEQRQRQRARVPLRYHTSFLC